MSLKGKAKQKYAKQYYRDNRKAIIAKTTAYLLSHPEVKKRIEKNRIYKEHDITQAEYERLLKEQSGRCAICNRKDGRALSVDHDHSHCIGEQSCSLCNRGLLCNKCNKKLAVIEESVFLEKALIYLRRWRRK